MPPKSTSTDVDDGHVGALGLTIRRAEHALSGAIGTVLRDLGITVTQYGALLALAESPGQSGAQLARACVVTPQSMASVLRTLANRGLIDRTPSPVHGRVQIATVSPAGQAVLLSANKRLRTATTLSDVLDKPECLHLRDRLERVVTRLTSV
jgi:DNA-binding MarR family transcriptional regulator